MKQVLVILFISLPFVTYAQSALVTTGGNAQGSGGSVSYSIGLVFYEVASANGITVTQGVQHPGPTSSVTGFETEDLQISAYPNPATKGIIVATPKESSVINLELIDMQGHRILSQEVNTTQTYISLSDLAVGEYILRAITPQKIKTFKIIKSE